MTDENREALNLLASSVLSYDMQVRAVNDKSGDAVVRDLITEAELRRR